MMPFSPESTPDPTQIDPLRLVYLLVLDGQGPPDLLVHLDPSRVQEAAYRFLSDILEERIRVIEAHQLLSRKYPGIHPHPLWRAWMETTQSLVVERLRAELFGTLTS